MFYLSYLWAETRRRWGRTLLTGIGLGVGVALVIAVSALSAGLDQAQKQVLKPLTGVGTDMTVQRPITVNNNGGGLSKKEQKQLQKEAGPGRVGLGNLGKPGSHFSRESLTSTSSLSFKESVEKDVAGISGVKQLSGYLALNQVHVSGKVPKNSTQGGGGFAGGGGGGAPNINGVNFSTTTVTGIDASNPGLSPLSQSQIQKGHYLRDSGTYQAVVSLSYARDKSLGVGDKVSVGGKDFTIVGLAKQSLGGNTADIYVNLATLQKVAKYQGRVNSLDVRATSTGIGAVGIPSDP